jgi:hypothetical protein
MNRFFDANALSISVELQVLTTRERLEGYMFPPIYEALVTLSVSTVLRIFDNYYSAAGPPKISSLRCNSRKGSIHHC